MNAQEIIKEAEEYAAEWLEMSADPSAVIAGILANKIVHLMDHIEFLERLAKHESRRR